MPSSVDEPPESGQHGDSDSHARRLVAELVEHRAGAARLLEEDASVGELQSAARGLGIVLLETAGDDDLWERLATHGEGRRALTAHQRVQLGAAIEVDWSILLDSVGYQSPPPADVLEAELVAGIQQALESRESAQIATARQRLHDLAEELVGVSEPLDIPKSRVKRVLRRGVRVAARVVIVAGVAAAGVALLHVAPIAALGFVGSEVAVELLKEGAVQALDWLLDRTLREEPDAGHPDEDPADRAAFEAIRSIDVVDYAELTQRWDYLHEQEMHGVLHPERLVEMVPRSAELIERTIRALYLVWDVSAGAQWNSPDTQMLCGRLRTSLVLAREALAADPPDAASISITLKHTLDALTPLSTRIGTQIGHR